MKPDFRRLIETLAKKGGLEILMMLKDSPKRWSWLEHQLKDKKSTSYRIKELLDLGILEITIIHDTPTGTKAYKLSPLGEKIVKLIEEMQKEFEKWHYQPESDEEFLERKMSFREDE
ncbi:MULTISPECIES: winged helix-turn-helix transcriptional regulator [unclassified Archaeoglobus]|jgi:DNA-binding HxlR family transcriptional regulator|uniref:winged helix-turn-helix transcriptional regulator n=1 Tax=unclassified Archaeoglobus TaxID=2643606 RepID=UPI0025BFE768|nr:MULTISPECIES: winged helix-turn-helix transcriptional regulator [unclassified Archaeoglobus]